MGKIGFERVRQTLSGKNGNAMSHRRTRADILGPTQTRLPAEMA